MAKKKAKSKNQAKPAEMKTTSSSNRGLQILVIIFSIIIVLSMILAALNA